MEKKINNTLLFTGKDGSQMVFHVLFTYHSDNFNKDYAVFYNEADENEVIVYAYDADLTLSVVQTEEEYAELDQALQQFDQEQATNN
ncbi:MAG: DUF1292 domain-containing protein [Clostridia bacterium]|nr:DUF1292 domain-containing protein [Clostridia bacterium]